MTTITFRPYPSSKTVRFTCAACGKGGRTKTIRHECTVNPFNKNDDGSVKTPDEVQAQSRELVLRDLERFLREPVCATCEGKMNLMERGLLRERRNNSLPPTPAGAEPASRRDEE